MEDAKRLLPMDGSKIRESMSYGDKERESVCECVMCVRERGRREGII